MGWSILRGFRELLPEEMEFRRTVIEAIRRVFELYGFREVLTPTLEPFELFERKAGEEIERGMFVFTDKGGRRVVLRPEMTAPVSRTFARLAKAASLPVKWYYIANMFRYEEPQRLRYREFWQAGVEVIGADSLESDLEVLMVTSDALREAGLERHFLRVGDVRIVRGMLAAR
ncbi:MAG: histidine--tRNA ligase, partial [Thermoproteota archaeon]